MSSKSTGPVNPALCLLLRQRFGEATNAAELPGGTPWRDGWVRAHNQMATRFVWSLPGFLDWAGGSGRRPGLVDGAWWRRINLINETRDVENTPEWREFCQGWTQAVQEAHHLVLQKRKAETVWVKPREPLFPKEVQDWVMQDCLKHLPEGVYEWVREKLTKRDRWIPVMVRDHYFSLGPGALLTPASWGVKIRPLQGHP